MVRVTEQCQWVHKLSNLAVLTRKKNSSASNYDFDKKKQAYFCTKVVFRHRLTTQVLDNTERTPAIVAARHNSSPFWKPTGDCRTDKTRQRHQSKLHF